MKPMPECKILVADEDSKTINSVKSLFAKDRVATVLTARSADIAVEMAWRNKPDVIISNTRLLDLTGWEVFGILRKNDLTRSIPFIMIDEKDGWPENEVKAFALGMDDYINKPFLPEVFSARVRAVMKRAIDRNGQKQDVEEIIKSGDITVNISTHTISVNGKLLDLTPKEFALLYLFMKKKNRVLNKVFLASTIWEREYFDTSYTIDKHIANLRKKLGKEGKRIQTLPTIGYKFVEEETEEELSN